MRRKLTKSSTDYALTGVCGGIGERVNIDPILIRIIFLFLPGNLFIYIILNFIMPDELPS